MVKAVYLCWHKISASHTSANCFSTGFSSVNMFYKLSANVVEKAEELQYVNLWSK